ncbi:MAG TPA: DUF5565 family protein [Mycobacteriales bacterium]|jgi:hypothetical protein|nr:DUF5565 family protein [Mycobacteriales bacterium]
MRKIPTVFLRDEQDRKYVTSTPNPDAAWVFAGEGQATRKYDGTCVRTDGETWWARREVKPGKTAPAGFEPVEHDETTGKTVGWEPAEQSAFVKYLREALTEARELPAGTYELIGPKVNGNPERADRHVLVSHDAAARVAADDLTYEGIRQAVLALADDGVEGIVWHHPDGRMAKIKARDFARSAGTPVSPA